MIRYTLAYPPTLNNLFANGKAGRFRTEHYRRWAQQAGNQIIEQGRQKMRGPVSISIALVKPDKRKRDLDNALKATVDLLVSMQVIEDDSLIERLTIQWTRDAAFECAVIVQKAEEAIAA